MSKTIQSVRGMNDILPAESCYWQQLEQAFCTLAQAFAYEQIRFPVVELTRLFKRTIGESTDIVEKEMYTFADRNGDSLSLRPEGTASCARAGLQHGLFYKQQQRLWYFGPMYRHERPQKGRYRQFYQYGLEAIGGEAAEIDVETIQFSHALLSALNLMPYVSLEINSIGTPACREAHRSALLAYLKQHETALDDEALARRDKNPLRLFDSKHPTTRAIMNDAPKISDYLSTHAREHFDTVKMLLNTLGIPYRVNTTLVRGLDYYCHTVYEWVTASSGTQNAVCSGGRYDSLIEQLGGPPTPAVGFALGAERVVALLAEQDGDKRGSRSLHVFAICLGDNSKTPMAILLASLRNQQPQLSCTCFYESVSLKAQLKKADKLGAHCALILGEDECAQQTVTIKFLQSRQPQMTVAQTEVVACLSKAIFGA